MGQFELVMEELEGADDEHPDVAISGEDGWSMSYFKSGRLIFEHLDRDDVAPRHMLAVPRARAVELWAALARGDLATVEREPWRPGYV